MLLNRYEDLVAQGVELQQASMPSSSSFSNVSAASHDIAPDTPHRSPTRPPSPTHRGSDPAGGSAFSATQPQEKETEPTTGGRSSSQAPAVDDWVDSNKVSAQHAVSNISPAVQSGGESSSQEGAHVGRASGSEQAFSAVEMQIRHSHASGVHAHSRTDNTQRAVAALPKMLPLTSAQKHRNSASEAPSSPLLASSNGTLLSDKLANATQLLSQDTMLRNHQDEQSEVHAVGLSKVAVQTGFRNAGKVSMVDGTTEPVTEALEALSSAGKSPEEVINAAADSKGRIMKVFAPSWNDMLTHVCLPCIHLFCCFDPA